MRIQALSIVLSAATLVCTGATGADAADSTANASHTRQLSVQIYRDGKGIPHIFADTAPAIMFGVGYSLAEDRLADVELKKRSAAGTRAEILGAAAIDGDMTARDRALPASELMRMYRAIPAEHRAMMQGFVDGINRT